MKNRIERGEKKPLGKNDNMDLAASAREIFTIEGEEYNKGK